MLKSKSPDEFLMKIISSFILLVLCISPVFSDDIDLDELGWPRDVIFKNGVITIYQPQIESYDKISIEARAAIAVKFDEKTPIFGAMWFISRVLTDMDERLVNFDKIVVETLKFPEEEEAKVEKIQKSLGDKLSGICMVMSLDRFSESIEHLQGEGDIVEDFDNTPPEIYYETSPAVLVFIDGDPILKEVENSTFKYVLNSPFFLVLNDSDKKYYLKGGAWWYSSEEIEKGWKPIDAAPKSVVELAEQAFQGDANDVDSLSLDLDAPPKIIISTKPAELIQTDGEPKFEPVTGTELLFLTNSEIDIIMDITSQQYYIMISGRWYKSKSLDSGDWEYVAPNSLPDDFEKIPKDSDISDVLYSVPGTQESKDALLDNSIPQTAEIDRKTATVEIQYDGNPKFTKIESTSISYAENADKTVLLISKKYYAVDNAVWFVSSKATGPWEVCVEVPEEVQDIPPESPVYNVKYVYVYDHTPDVVYVGYTPGYYGSYAYYGTVIYGTGYWYRPWYATYYYPRPVTYGFGVHYNPWTGWGYSVGVSYGWVTFGWHSYHRGWWGACGYRYGYRHGYGHGYGHGYRHGYRHGYNAGRRAGYRAGYRAGSRNSGQSNVYRNRANGVRNTGARPATRQTNPSAGTRPSTQQAQPRTRNNDVYSDRSGNVYKRDNSGSWQQRSNGQWSNSSGSRQGQATSPSNMNRDYNSRSQGNQRANSYSNRGGASAPRSRPNGGGGRRR